MEPRKASSHEHGSLASEGSQVALGTARSLTSHARHIYQTKYRGRYRFAAWVFALDAFLVGLAAALCVAIIAFVSISPRHFDGGLSVSLSSAPLRGSEETPLTATISSSDGKTHTGIQLRLEIPDWAEIVRSEPALRPDGSVDLGDVGPRSPQSIILVIRPRLPNVNLPVTFDVRQDDWTGFIQNVQGTLTRSVGPSALTALPDQTVTSTSLGGLIPFTIQNTAANAIPSVIFRLSDVEGGTASIGGTETLSLGSLEAGESRRILVNVDQVASSTLALTWQVQDGAQPVTGGSTTYPIVSGSIGQSTTQAFASNTFPLSSSARYYSSTGDQLGVGPLPPQVGQPTTYWLAFTLGPTDGRLSDLDIQATLPKGVKATGHYAAPAAATFVTKDDMIEWKSSELDAIGAPGLTLAFEVSFTPSKTQAGAVAPLLSVATAQARTDDGRVLSATSTSVTTDLTDDAKAAGKGIIQP